MKGFAKVILNFYIDGSAESNCEYLGTEDYFGFSWTLNSTWYDDFSGTTFLNYKDGITKLACYRFMLNNPMRVEYSLKAQVNYEHETNNPSLNQAKKDNSGLVDFKLSHCVRDKTAAALDRHSELIPKDKRYRNLNTLKCSSYLRL